MRTQVGYAASDSDDAHGPLRDHREATISTRFAAVTDRGIQHRNNEDDFAIDVLRQEDGSQVPILIVCDGLSSSDQAQQASSIAAKIALDYLKQNLARKSELSGARVAEVMGEAIAAANSAVCSLIVPASSATADPPATTLIAAIVCDQAVILGWVGDSRAYWIDCNVPEKSRLLTHDHSWINEVVDAGQMTETEARQNRLAHAITRCLGVSDDPEGSTPSFVTFPVPTEGGILMLCSDGLWNYAPDTVPLAERVRENLTAGTVIEIARSLITFANNCGGRDNITVALLGVEPESPS